MNVDGIKQAVEDNVIAELKRRHEDQQQKARLEAVVNLDLSKIELRVAARQAAERRLSIESIPDPRTPYVRTLEKLWPTLMAQAVAESLGRRPPPVLGTFIELGHKQPQLVRLALPL